VQSRGQTNQTSRLPHVNFWEPQQKVRENHDPCYCPAENIDRWSPSILRIPLRVRSGVHPELVPRRQTITCKTVTLSNRKSETRGVLHRGLLHTWTANNVLPRDYDHIRRGSPQVAPRAGNKKCWFGTGRPRRAGGGGMGGGGGRCQAVEAFQIPD